MSRKKYIKMNATKRKRTTVELNFAFKDSSFQFNEKYFFSKMFADFHRQFAEQQ